MTWTPDERTRKAFGPRSMVSERHSKRGQSAHLITLRDGRTLRVLPTDTISGLRRSRIVSEALATAERLDLKANGAESALVIGYIDEAGLDWEWADLPDTAIAEWFEGWWHRMTNAGHPRPFVRLTSDLARAGWKIIPIEPPEGGPR